MKQLMIYGAYAVLLARIVLWAPALLLSWALAYSWWTGELPLWLAVSRQAPAHMLQEGDDARVLAVEIAMPQHLNFSCEPQGDAILVSTGTCKTRLAIRLRAPADPLPASSTPRVTRASRASPSP